VRKATAAKTVAGLEDGVGSRVYLHEYIDIIGAGRADYFEHMTAGWREAAAERRQRTFGIWGTLGSTGRWPEVVNLWEYDDWDHLAETFDHETAGKRGMQDPKLETWWRKAQTMRRGGYDRLLIPSAASPSIAEVIARGIVGWRVFRHDLVGVVPGEARNYLAAVESELVPLMGRLGATLIGAYRTAMRDDSEVLLIWAIRDWRTWSALETGLDEDPAARAWRDRTRAIAPQYSSHLMCSAPLSPTETGRQP
jgi:hypothetical protein